MVLGDTMRARAVAAVLLFLIAATCAYAAPPAVAVKDVHTIYLGRFGDSDEAERFRMVLSIELPRRGFTLVHTLNDADAELQGILTIHESVAGPVVSCTAELVNQHNDRVWAGDYGPKTMWRPAPWPAVRDGVKDIGRTIAKELEKARTKKQ